MCYLLIVAFVPFAAAYQSQQRYQPAVAIALASMQFLLQSINVHT